MGNRSSRLRRVSQWSAPWLLVSSLRWDYPLLAAGLIIGILSLYWPLILDNALMFVVGRDWLEGAVPYRDLFEQKTPFMFGVNALAVALFGAEAFSIRLLELIWLAGISAVIYALFRDPEKPYRGLWGLSFFSLALSYWGTYVGFAAISETWCVGFVLISWLCLKSCSSDAGAYFLAGLFWSLSVAAKPPAVMFTPALLMAAYYRTPRIIRLMYLTGVAVLAGLIPWIVTFGYFYLAGALEDFNDIFFGLNRFYIEIAGADYGKMGRRILGLFLGIHPFSTVILAAFAFAAFRKPRSRTLWIILLFIQGALGAVLIQKRLIMRSHPVMLTTFFSVMVTYTVTRLRLPPVWAAVVLAAAFCMSPQFEKARGVGVDSFMHMTGKMSRIKYMSRFNERMFPAVDVQRVGEWIRKNSGPEDLIAVRGYLPAVYIISGRKSASRHFWTLWLTMKDRTYRREEFLAGDLRQLIQNRPRYAVVLDNVRDGPDSAAYFGKVGDYARVFSSGNLVVLELKE